LDSEDLILRPQENPDDWRKIAPSDFVEVRGVFQPNPIVDFLQRLDRFLSLLEILPNTIFPTQTPGQSSKKKSPSDHTKEVKQYRHFLQGVLKDVEENNTRIFVIESSMSVQFQTLVLLFRDYLRDRTITEITYREYRLLGKVVRKIEQQSAESIELLQGTALGGIDKGHLEKLWNALNDNGEFNLPKVKSEIYGPALEVNPIAIYI
jgi:hypothetical protein